jgi:hypothetical protein
MGKIGYAPKWESIHSKVAKEFQAKRGEQGEISPKFTTVDKAMEWLNNDS